MNSMSRRSVIRGSMGLAATGALAHPYIANAAAATATVWQVQGFVPEEDAAFRKTVDDYEKATGNKIDLSVMPFQALNQKAISAITSGDVPDLIFHDAPATILPQNAWNDKLVDVSDVVEDYKSRLSETALLNSSFYNGTTKQRAFYLCPVKQATSPFHIWGDLVTKAGFKLSDAPNTWDAFWSFRSPRSDRTTATGCSPISWSPTGVRTFSPGTASCTPTIRRCARRRSGRSSS
jgi:multiple sugar transport system substrate-binding protein